MLKFDIEKTPGNMISSKVTWENEVYKESKKITVKETPSGYIKNEN
jgi:hypothetical protein